jgi:hypothetical protein
MWNYMGSWWASGMGLFMTVFWLIVVVGVVALVWGLVLADSPSRAAEGRRADSALYSGGTMCPGQNRHGRIRAEETRSGVNWLGQRRL